MAQENRSWGTERIRGKLLYSLEPLTSPHDDADADERNHRADEIKEIWSPMIEDDAPRDGKHDEDSAVRRINPPESRFALKRWNHTIEKQYRAADHSKH